MKFGKMRIISNGVWVIFMRLDSQEILVSDITNSNSLEFD